MIVSTAYATRKIFSKDMSFRSSFSKSLSHNFIKSMLKLWQ